MAVATNLPPTRNEVRERVLDDHRRIRALLIQLDSAQRNLVDRHPDGAYDVAIMTHAANAGPPMGGIFVGGASARMGSPKGLLVHRGKTLIARWIRVLAEAGVEPVLVGARPEYARLGLPTLADEVSNEASEGVARGGKRGVRAGNGPLGGLCALLDAAGSRQVLCVACDMQSDRVQVRASWISVAKMFS